MVIKISIEIHQHSEKVIIIDDIQKGQNNNIQPSFKSLNGASNADTISKIEILAHMESQINKDAKFISVL